MNYREEVITQLYQLANVNMNYREANACAEKIKTYFDKSNELVADTGNELIAQLRQTVNDLNLGNSGLHNELVKTREKCEYFQKKMIDYNQDLNDVITQKNEELERETLDLEELKCIRSAFRTYRVPLPRLYNKLVKMIMEREPVVVKEMTVEEIEKQLGYTIKVIK